MADRFMQQYTGPARAEHHGHHAGRGRDRLQVDQRLAQRLAGEALGPVVGEQFGIAETATTAGVAGLAAAVLFHDHLHVEPHQRADVAGQHAVAAGDQHRVHAAGQAHHHLLHARVGSTQVAV